MTNAPQTSISDSTAAQLERRLRSAVDGDVRFGRLHRAMYATDASIYQIAPIGVLLPKNAADVVAAVRICAELGVPIVPRGAGTGLTGGAVGDGLQIDFSRYMNHIGRLDLERRTVEVEPGVVLDELNARLAPHGLRFAPDVATSSRATIGGMIANNSCGAGSVRWGRTVDHVLKLRCILADGNVVDFDDPVFASPLTKGGVDADAASSFSRVERIQSALADLRERYHDEIVARFPKVLRSNGGYGLDRLGAPGTPINACKVLCGSEGTLALIVGATLSLVPIPKHAALCVLHFRSVLDAVSSTPGILKHGPAAVELIDRLILDSARANASLAARCDILEGDPDALLVVELHDEDADSLTRRLGSLTNDPDARGAAYAAVIVRNPNRQADIWRIRTSGLGLLMSKPGDKQPYSFVEDTAVDPSRLREYLACFAEILDAEGVHAGYYAHASVGCIHVKPVLNLRSPDGVQKMRRIAEAVADLALEFGGTFTGEHGDGIIRSSFIEKMYGPRIVAAFAEVKRLFDPNNVLNPHKIVDPWPMTERLRFSHFNRPISHKPALDFSLHVTASTNGGAPGAGGIAGLAEMCSGVGQCRQRLVGTMCPSYMATGDELHSTRGRANALRIALSDQGLLDGLDDPALNEVMDLCLSCKACKTECPTGVDMARLKAELRHRRNLVYGASKRSRLIAEMPARLAFWSHFPRLANRMARSRLAHAWMQSRYQLDARLAPPQLANRTFRHWFRGRSRAAARTKAQANLRPIADAPFPRGPVIYFVDCWTNHFTPEVGIAAVKLLERAGFRVLCPGLPCCGRPAISQGLLLDAKQLALQGLRGIAEAEWAIRTEQRAAGSSVPSLSAPPLPRGGRGGALAAESATPPTMLVFDDIPILGSEPSCLLTLVDEYPQLVRSPSARRVAHRAMLVETFLARLLAREPDALRFSTPASPLLYHAHCHQKALVGSQDARFVLRAAYGDRAAEINSGCCGMAGAFGHEMEHYDIARAVGEQRLFPAVRARGGASIAVSGFSCKQQIEHHTDARPRHILEYLADGLASPFES